MLGKKIFNLFILLLICVALKVNRAKVSNQVYNKNQKISRQSDQNFHDVDAFGDDFIDFGSKSGSKGQFSW